MAGILDLGQFCSGLGLRVCRLLLSRILELCSMVVVVMIIDIEAIAVTVVTVAAAGAGVGSCSGGSVAVVVVGTYLLLESLDSEELATPTQAVLSRLFPHSPLHGRGKHLRLEARLSFSRACRKLLLGFSWYFVLRSGFGRVILMWLMKAPTVSATVL